MNRFFILTLAFIIPLLYFVGCTQAEENIVEPLQNYFVYCNPLIDSASVHISPDPSSEVIGTIKNESLPFCGVDYNYDWYEVVFQGKKAYVWSSSSIIVNGSYHTIRPVYYVSIGGGLSLEEVYQKQAELSNRDFESPIFVTMDKDLRVYRICPDCSYDISEAKTTAEWYNSIGIESFVWESIGQAKCIEQPYSMACIPQIVSPEPQLLRP